MAKKSGNKLTQNIDENDNLQNTVVSTLDRDMGGTTSSADIRKELFDRPDVRTKALDKKVNRKL